jgi:hypothetical protein
VGEWLSEFRGDPKAKKMKMNGPKLEDRIREHN